MNYNRIFEVRPGLSVVLMPDPPKFTVIAVSDDFVRITGIERATIVGNAFFSFFPAGAIDPALSGEQDMRASFQHVIDHKEPHQLPRQRYDVPGSDGRFTESHWKALNLPVCDDAGDMMYIMHTLEELTAPVKSRQREEGLRDLEKVYQLFMTAPVIIGILSGDDYVIELANEGLLEVWGRTSEVIGKPLLQAIPELETQGLIPLLDKVRSTGEPFYAYEFPILLNRHGKTEELYFDFVYKAIYTDGAGRNGRGVISVGHDVTEQVRARRGLAENEAKYRNLFDSIDQGFCVLEMIFDENNQPVNYRFIEANPVFEKQTGLKDAVGKMVLDLVPNLERNWLELYGKVALTGVPMRFSEGSQAMGRWFEVYAFRVGSAGSRKVALLFSDISERRKSEEALLQSERNLRNTILQAPVAMAILKGRAFEVEIANDRMYELWGRGKDQMLNKPLFEALPEVRDQGYEELLNSVYTTGEPFSALGIPVNVPRDGSLETIYINLLYTAFREGDGTISGIMAVASDVTEQVKARQKIEEVVAGRTQELAAANEALVHSNQELQRSNQNLEEFAYAASHDLKEPMRKIQLFTDRLKANLEGGLSAEERNFFDRILHATQRMNTLIDDLLMYSHVSRGAALEEKVDLNQKVRTVLEDLELEVAEKKAEITFDSLPVIKGHRRQLQQLFQNLIGNAIKYTRPQVAPRVHISSRLVKGTEEPHIPPEKKNEPYYLIEVRDNGIGFDPGDAERIFNVFTRLHGNSEYKGTGVGLSIVRKVVENHGGLIWAESREGEGATFKVLLPAA